MTYSQQVQNMCPITKGPKHGPAPIPEDCLLYTSNNTRFALLVKGKKEKTL